MSALFSVLFAVTMWVQVPQWSDDWSNCAVDVPDTSCHWYIVNPDNTFGEGFDWETAPWYSVEGLQDIADLHDSNIDNGYAYTLESLNDAKVVNVIALLSGLVSLGVLGGSFYLYKNVNVIVESAKQEAIQEIAKSLPNIVNEMMPAVPIVPSSTGPAIPSLK